MGNKISNVPLSKDTWVCIANFLNKNDIACLKASCKQLNKWLEDHPRLIVDKIDYEFWEPLLEKLIDETGGCYGTDDYCVMIESIDRGVESFTQFAKSLKKAYPNIKELDFEQNYSYLEEHPEEASYAQQEFIEFIRYLGLTYLKIQDSQSGFFEYFEWEKILDAMPERSEYVVITEVYDCDYGCVCYHYGSYKDFMGGNGCSAFRIFEKDTKKLVVHCDYSEENSENNESR